MCAWVANMYIAQELVQKYIGKFHGLTMLVGIFFVFLTV